MPFRKVSWPKRAEMVQTFMPASAEAAGEAEEDVEADAADAAGAGAAPSVKARRRMTRSARLSFCSGVSALSSAAVSTRNLIWSLHCRSKVLMSGLRAMSPSRILSSRVSTWWVNSTTRFNPKMPAEPLTVWAQRKRLSRSSRLSGCSSSSNSRVSMASICSAASEMKAGMASRMKSWSESLL